MKVTRTYLTEIEGESVAVEVTRLGDGRYRVQVGEDEGREYDARRVGRSSVSLLRDGHNAEASVIVKGDTYDVLLDGARRQISLTPEMKARRAAAGGRAATGGRQEIRASMSGKVVEVLVAVGDTVEAKQGVLIVEAMKMENEIKATGPGEIKEITVEPGQAVESGEILAILE